VNLQEFATNVGKTTGTGLRFQNTDA